MFEVTTEPLSLDIFRVLTRYDDVTFEDADGTTVDMLDVWSIDLAHGIRDAAGVLGENESGWLEHGVVKVEDAREIDVIEGWVTVDRLKVTDVERVFLPEPVRESGLQLIRDALADAEQRLDESDESDESDEEAL
jgi:hypothetical protein